MSATDEDALQTDTDTDGEVDRGDTVRHSITITNAGDGDAQDLQFDTTLDGNTTLVPGSVVVGTPFDAFVFAGNELQFLDGTVVDDPGGTPLNIIHVDSIHTGTNAGTFENPFQTLSHAESGSAANDIVLVHADSVFTGEGFLLKSNQRLLGDPIQHLVDTQQFGTIVLPVGNPAGSAIPVLDIPATTAIVILSVSDVEVSGFTIQNSAIGGIVSASATGTIEVNNVTINGTTSRGIFVLDTSATFNFSDVIVMGTGAEAFRIGEGAATVTFSGDIINSSDRAVVISGPSGASLTMSGGSITDTGGRGITIGSTFGTVSIDNATITNSTLDGIILASTTGTVTFTNTTIVDPANAAVSVSGGSSTLTYGGDITQSNSASAVSVLNHTTGTVTFQNGTISATNGDGLQFDNADGTYDFTGTTTLNGVEAGIAIITGSSGTLTFSNATTVTNPSAKGFALSASPAVVMYNGTTAGGSSTLVDIDDLQTGGSVTFVGDVTVTSGLGIEITNSEGDVTFGTVTLGAALARLSQQPVRLTTNTGTYTFNALAMFNTTEDGFVANGSGTVEVLDGTPDTDGGDALRLIDTDVGAAGVTFASIDADGGGVDLDGVDGPGSVSLGDVTIPDAGTGSAVSIQNATVDVGVNSLDVDLAGVSGVLLSGTDGTVTITNGDITGTTGTAFSVAGGAGDVTYNGNITQAISASAVRVAGGHTGTVTLQNGTIRVDGGAISAGGAAAVRLTNTAIDPAGMTFSTLDSDGGGMVFSGVTGGLFDGGTTTVLNAGGTGLSVSSCSNSFTFSSATVNTAGSDGILLSSNTGTVTINGGSITGAAGTAVNVDGGSATLTYAGSITNTAGEAVNVQDRIGGIVTFSGAINDTGTGLTVTTNSGGSTTFSGSNSVVNSGTNTAITLTSDAGHTINFTGGGLDIDTTTGTGFAAAGGGTVNVSGANNTINTGSGRVADIQNTNTGTGITFAHCISTSG